MQIELHAFERADDGGSAVLRVTASAPAGARPPSLGVYARDQVQRVDAQPDSANSGGLLSAEYRVPAKLLAGAPATFWLELEDGTVIDLPAPTALAARARRSRAAEPSPKYAWRLRELMAERDMYSTTDLAAPLARRGVSLSTTQVYRLVTGTPERLNLKLLVALCDFLDCSPNDLIEVSPRAARPGAGRQR
jgi:DNA-binding Xre family transcriptional regulator